MKTFSLPVYAPKWLRFVLGLSLLFLLLTRLVPNESFGGNFYNGISPLTVPWPNGIVPFEFTNTLTAAQRQTYLDGLREWELAAQVQFVPHTNQARWILFTYNTNYLDNVAPGYSPQVVTVSSLSRAQVCHEVGHSLGFTHENIRPDQANYLNVMTNNIGDEPANITFFTIDPNSVTNGNYDFESVMHLGWDFASSNPGVLATQKPKPAYFPRFQYRMGNLCLSPGDRAALAYLYGPPAMSLTNVVTTTADWGPGSLRAAIYYASDHPGTPIRFNLSTNDAGFSNAVFNIHLSGHLPPLAVNGMVLDGSTQPGFAGNPLIAVDGSRIIPETFTSNSGLLIYSSGNQVKNISFSGFNWNGLTLEFADATNNSISGCWLGLDSTGSHPAPNTYQGILLGPGASRNTIGGTNALARNVISGNAQYALWMSDTNTTENRILGNYIGTDASGSFAVGNALGGIGIFYNGQGHIIGGTNAGARNVISGNGSAGIWLSGAGVSNNAVRGNFIGLNAAGNVAIPNTFAGLYVVNGASANEFLNNIISGNQSEGLRISDQGTAGNRVQGNWIGTDATGTQPIPNGSIGLSIYTGASANMIGGTNAASGNLLSGNYEGLRLQGRGVSGNVIQGNWIGTDITGTNAMPNQFGLTIYSGAASNQIGGVLGMARNVISGNAQEGLRLSDPGTSYNLIEGNYIGTDLTGSSPVANGFAGLTVYAGSSWNRIGGTVTGARNIVAGNGGYYGYGLILSNPGTSQNLVQGNYIGIGPDGISPIPNFYGVLMADGATSNWLGGTLNSAQNLISGNRASGVFVADAGTSNNLIQGNYIGVDATGTNAAANGFEGIYLTGGASGNWIGGASPGAGNVISGNTYRGIYAEGTNTSGNWISGNYIGTAADAVSPLGNHWDGVVFFDGAGSNVVGLTTGGEGSGNVIAFNGANGIYVGSDNSDPSVGNTFRGNRVLLNARLGINLAGGIEDVYGVTANHLGGGVPGPNDLQNYPILTNVSVQGSMTVVSGSLTSSSNRQFLIDLYRNRSPDPSGHGQGQIYVGTVTVVADATGFAGFSLVLGSNELGQYFCATATDQANGDTSEFSADVVATNGPSAPGFIPPLLMTRTGFWANLSLISGQNYRVQAATNLEAHPVIWQDLTNFAAPGNAVPFIDPESLRYPMRFYRVVSP